MSMELCMLYMAFHGAHRAKGSLSGTGSYRSRRAQLPRRCSSPVLQSVMIILMFTAVTTGNEHETHVLDNGHLPVGDKVAILIVGLSRSITPALMLPSLREHVLRGLGEKHVHVFVHTCARANSDFSDEQQTAERQELVDMYRELIPEEVLKAVVVTSPDYGRYQVHIRLATELNSSDEAMRGVPRMWEYPFERYPLTLIIQFDSMQDLFRLVLREEIRQEERYSHMIRIRTDSIWSARWPPHHVLSARVPPASNSVAVVPTQGPLLDDHFWISSRAAAWRVFFEMPEHLRQPVDRRHMYRVFGCEWEGIGAAHARVTALHYDPDLSGSEHLHAAGGGVAGKIFSDDMFELPGDACYYTMVSATLGHSVWVDTTIKYLLLQWGLNFVDCCGITGEFIHSGSHEVFLRACPGPRHLFPEEEGGWEAEEGGGVGVGEGGCGEVGGACWREEAVSLREGEWERRGKADGHEERVMGYYQRVLQLVALEHATRPLAKGGDPVL